jgi:hypothetical protein
MQINYCPGIKQKYGLQSSHWQTWCDTFFRESLFEYLEQHIVKAGDQANEAPKKNVFIYAYLVANIFAQLIFMKTEEPKKVSLHCLLPLSQIEYDSSFILN